MSKPISDAQIYVLLWGASCVNGTFAEIHGVPHAVNAPDGRAIILSRTAVDRSGLLGLGRRGLMANRYNGLWSITDLGRAELLRPAIANRIAALADATAAEAQRSRDADISLERGK